MCVFHSPALFTFYCLLSVFSFHRLFFFFVLSLPDGAAMRAGVQTGDRIIKVACLPAAHSKPHVSHFHLPNQCVVCRLPPCGRSVFFLSFPAMTWMHCAVHPHCEPWGFSHISNVVAIAVLQVNGTLVTRSNHIEVVKLIKCKPFCCRPPFWTLCEPFKSQQPHCFFPSAGSYVALTVLGRPPGLAQIPLSEVESEMLGVSISSPNSPAAERPYSPQDRFSSTLPSWVWKSCGTPHLFICF